MPRRYRNCILIGLLACDSSCMHGHFMPPSLSWKLLHFDWLVSFEIVTAQNYKVSALFLTKQNQVTFFMYMIIKQVVKHSGRKKN